MSDIRDSFHRRTAGLLAEHDLSSLDRRFSEDCVEHCRWWRSGQGAGVSWCPGRGGAATPTWCRSWWTTPPGRGPARLLPGPRPRRSCTWAFDVYRVANGKSWSAGTGSSPRPSATPGAR
ncbi:hypothetical protein QJS66_15150 [Kocuria rhizophila]|nr:hypothetical protein QJS66_15150 [Kocuria rhizophila]